MTTPLVSVVIPTYGRPQYLSRAISSALESAPDGDVEVLVVPNGPDKSWREKLLEFRTEHRVQFSPIKQGHANAARNHGLRQAAGKYVRFLDDDDWLFPEMASQQIEFAEDNALEICSGRIQHMDENLQALGQVGISSSRDFVCASLKVGGFTLPTGNVFLRSALGDAAWNEDVPRIQDYVWMLNLAAMKEWQWKGFPEQVGAWLHHSGPRVSSGSAHLPLPTWVFDAILSLHRQLELGGRLTDERRSALAEAIWGFVHNSFPRFPLQCHNYARQALRIDRKSRPSLNTYKLPLIEGGDVSPLLLEWLMLPKRYVNHLVRSVGEYFRGEEIVRKL